jgi:hypothetical protein
VPDDRTREIAPLRQLALNMLTRAAGSGADAKTLAAATQRAYDDLARTLVPLIGEVGVTALTARAWHLAQRDDPRLALTRDSTPAGEPFAQLRFSLEQQDDPAVAADAAAVALAILLTLLVTFIGEPLTMSLLRRAWPDGSSDPSTQETRP